MAAGAKDVSHLAAWQKKTAAEMPPLRHFTRHMPKRRDEILDGGSLYWVVNGVIMVRQLVLDILSDTEADGSACAALVLHPELIRVEGRAMRAFQGWRYLDPKDAPADLAAMGKGAEEMPDSMRRALAALALL
ncbi:MULTISPECIES: DUF1489 family protein [unclassified Acidocella]|uniref:DUF1489 family protein n=1 Tax=unclassified Acidocella TaxID=2648610 RepID=UPI00210F9731|nr:MULTISPECIES: DUF1489 domain-containing protein [unclassified Acidocella]WBO61224.1 DUF1489 domain-containing protein [Acidocella sp. MX-AZ03]